MRPNDSFSSNHGKKHPLLHWGMVLVLGLWLSLPMCTQPQTQNEPGGQENSAPDAQTTSDTTPSPETLREEPATEPVVEKTAQKKLPVEWTTGLSRLDVGDQSKYRYLRVIVHLHSIYSHDACDGDPRVDGKKNLPCLQRLREALCNDAIDVAFLTEHKSLMAEGDPIEQMVMYQDGDQKLMEDGKVIGNQFRCPSGHEVMVFPGAENELMPVGFKRHPTPADGQTLSQLYGSNSKDAITRFKEAGAAVLIAHTESKPIDYLLEYDLHGLEIYNLHAAIDPRKRGPDLKLTPAESAVGAFYTYISNPDDYPHPDLVFLGFHQRIPLYLEMWDKVLEKKMVYAYGGSDAHENVLKTAMRDGQRPDSYARMMLWFSNHFFVKEKSVAAVREALFQGRSTLVFEVLGTPEVFEFYGMTQGGKRVDIGATTQEKVVSLHVEAIHPYFQSEASVQSEIKLIRIDAQGSKVVAEGKQKVELKDPSPGTYRVEVDITPTHLKHLLTNETQSYMRSYPWIHSNPIRIAAP